MAQLFGVDVLQQLAVMPQKFARAESDTVIRHRSNFSKGPLSTEFEYLYSRNKKADFLQMAFYLKHA